MNRLLGYVYLAVLATKLGVEAAVFSRDLHIVNAQLAPDSVERRYSLYITILPLPRLMNAVFSHSQHRRG